MSTQCQPDICIKALISCHTADLSKPRWGVARGCSTLQWAQTEGPDTALHVASCPPASSLAVTSAHAVASVSPPAAGAFHSGVGASSQACCPCVTLPAAASQSPSLPSTHSAAERGEGIDFEIEWMQPAEPGAQMALTRHRMWPGTPQGAACHSRQQLECCLQTSPGPEAGHL